MNTSPLTRLATAFIAVALTACDADTELWTDTSVPSAHYPTDGIIRLSPHVADAMDTRSTAFTPDYFVASFTPESGNSSYTYTQVVFTRGSDGQWTTQDGSELRWESADATYTCRAYTPYNEYYSYTHQYYNMDSELLDLMSAEAIGTVQELLDEAGVLNLQFHHCFSRVQVKVILPQDVDAYSESVWGCPVANVRLSDVGTSIVYNPSTDAIEYTERGQISFPDNGYTWVPASYYSEDGYYLTPEYYIAPTVVDEDEYSYSDTDSQITVQCQVASSGGGSSKIRVERSISAPTFEAGKSYVLTVTAPRASELTGSTSSDYDDYYDYY